MNAWRRRLVLLVAWSCAGAVAAQPLYESGRAAWNDGDYARARADLLAFRKEPYGRRPDVDYMLGTSGCRIPGQVRWGHDVLDWMLYAYALTQKSRLHVAQERDRCLDIALARLDDDLSQIVEERAAGMTGFGKTFYWAGEERQPIASYPIRRSRAMDREVFLERRIPFGDAAAALAMATALSPQGHSLLHERFLITSETGHSERDMRAIGRTLNRFVGFLQNTYGIDTPSYYLSVYLVDSPYEVRQLAERLHGLDVSSATVGYTFVDDGSVVAAVPGQAAGTLLHELFHLLVRQNFGDIPQWLDEGIAALYEVSGRRGDRYFGLPNWRGPVLAELWNDRPSVETLIRTEWFLFDDPAHARTLAPEGVPADNFTDRAEGRRQAAMMAMARYFTLYLEQQGQLATVFRAVRDRGFAELQGDARDHAVRVVVEALGQDGDRPGEALGAIDAAFATWFRSGAAHERRDPAQPVAEGGPIYVANAAVNVRTGPGTDYEKLTRLDVGTRVAVFDREDGWYEVRLADGTVAFVFGRYLDALR